MTTMHHALERETATTRRDFRRVRAAVVDSSARQRNEMRDALYDKGIPEPIVCKGTSAFFDAARREVLDLVVCEAGAFGDDFAAAIQRMRRSEFGANPFVIVIATLGDPSMDLVQDALNGGVDDLVLRPTSSRRIVERVELLIKDRKPFVTTRGYVGPTRRNTVRSDDDEGELVDVPNTLRGKVVDKLSDAAMRQAIERAVVAVGEKMSEHPLAGIDRLIQRLLEWRGGSPAGLRRDFAHLVAHSLEISRHYRDTDLDHVADLALALANLARRTAAQAPDSLRPIDFDLLRNLGSVIRGAILAADESKSAVHDIAAMVDHYNVGQQAHVRSGLATV
jgi:DNA-binding response OmpR family regulator